MKQRLIVIGPVPPPYHGVTVSTSLVLSNRSLQDLFDVEHVDTSDHRHGGVGTWDPTNAVIALRGIVRLVSRLRGRRGLVYFPLSQNVPGLVRDSLFVHATKLFGWTVAAHLRGGELDQFHAKQPLLMRRWIEKTLARVDALAVMGESLRPVVSGLIPEERVSVVPNGTPDLSLDATRRDPRTVLFLSNLRRRKGVAEALETAQLVLREQDARFVFAGAWESDELAHRLRHRANGDDRIVFLPPVRDDERHRLLETASILLFPPLEPEGHPRVVIEALAAGLPVVTTKRGAIVETVTDGEQGYLLDDPVPDLLADRLLKLLRDDELRAAMSTAARARYLESYTQEIADLRLTEWLVEVTTDRSR